MSDISVGDFVRFINGFENDILGVVMRVHLNNYVTVMDYDGFFEMYKKDILSKCSETVNLKDEINNLLEKIHSFYFYK